VNNLLTVPVIARYSGRRSPSVCAWTLLALLLARAYRWPGWLDRPWTRPAGWTLLGPACQVVVGDWCGRPRFWILLTVPGGAGDNGGGCERRGRRRNPDRTGRFSPGAERAGDPFAARSAASARSGLHLAQPSEALRRQRSGGFGASPSASI